MRLYRLVILIVLLWPFACSRAQDPYYININRSTGLPSDAVYEFFQDSKGFMWIACGDGLCRYDGFEFKIYINRHQSSLAGNGIREDKYGRIWYKNFDGYLYYVENDSLRSLKQNAAVGNADYGVIGDRLLVMQKRGVDVFDLKTLKVIKTIPIDAAAVLSELCFKGHYYISGLSSDRQGLLYEVSSYGHVEKKRLPQIGYLTYGNKGVLLYEKSATAKYLYEFLSDGQVLKIPTPPGAFIHNALFCDNKYWLLSPGGSWVYDSSGTIMNNGRPYYSDKNQSAVFKDRDGNHWIGTLDNGILFIPDINVKLVSAPGFTPNLMQASGGIVYIGTKDNTIYTYEPATNRLELKYKGDVRHDIVALLPDSARNSLYFATNEFAIADLALKRIRKQTLALKSIDIVDDKYCAFAASGLCGLIKISDKGVSPWDSLYSATVLSRDTNLCNLLGGVRGRSAAYDKATNKIYFASNTGLYAVTPRAVTEIKENGEPFFVRKLICAGNSIYALTPQQDIYSLLPGDKLQKLSLGDQYGRIRNITRVGAAAYATTTNGIYALRPEGANRNIGAFHSAIRGEGISDFEIVDGKLIASCEKGLVLGEVGRPASDAPPGFVVNKILVNGKAREGNAFELKYQENDVDIYYSILSFGIYHSYQLYYKINNGEWEMATANSRELKLISLSPGHYNISFELRSNGKNYPVSPLVFTVHEPFWAEWWFWAGCALLICATVVVYNRWQANLLKRENALKLEKMDLEKNLRNSMLTSLKAQMNPHFFYNALNTIQSFIFSDDKRSASTYLVKLSKLTRTVFEMSEKETISLEEETAALKLYLELEKMRFSDDFEFSLELGGNVTSELVAIPPMIVQPYVENAIKHGLLHKNGDKKLSIGFDRQDDHLCVTIDDNGIGRTRATELAKVRFEKHLSFATSANNKRIELLNKSKDKDIGVVYIDKTTEEGIPSGTTVIISIPLN